MRVCVCVFGCASVFVGGGGGGYCQALPLIVKNYIYLFIALAQGFVVVDVWFRKNYVVMLT